MPRIEILSAEDSNTVESEIMADEAFAESVYPGRWRLASHQGGSSPVTVPSYVTMRQARIALHRAGLLSQVEATIAALPKPSRIEAEIEWTYSSEVQRYNGFVSRIGPGLGLTEKQIDDLFILANSL